MLTKPELIFLYIIGITQFIRKWFIILYQTLGITLIITIALGIVRCHSSGYLTADKLPAMFIICAVATFITLLYIIALKVDEIERRKDGRR